MTIARSWSMHENIPGRGTMSQQDYCCCGKEGIRQANLSAGQTHLPDDVGKVLLLSPR